MKLWILLIGSLLSLSTMASASPRIIGKIVGDNDTIAISCAEDDGNKCTRVQFDGNQGLYLNTPAAVEGGEQWYDMGINSSTTWVFGFGGHVLYPAKKNVWQGIAIYTQQGPKMSDYRIAKNIISEVMTTGKNVAVSKKQFRSVTYILRYLSRTYTGTDSVNKGLPQGAELSESDKQAILLGVF